MLVVFTFARGDSSLALSDVAVRHHAIEDASVEIILSIDGDLVPSLLVGGITHIIPSRVRSS